jgi:hypothetical protein
MRKICTNRFGTFDDALQFEAWVAFHDAVGLDKYASAAEWNDQQKSVKPVIAALRKAMG